MALRSDGARTKKRILSACVRLFLEHGYSGTTMAQIYREAHVSSSSFQHLFHGKDGVLMELLQFLYDSQFGNAEQAVGGQLPPVYVYAVETAVQITIAELNENVRECYLEAYTCPETLDYIQRRTAGKLYEIFGPYQPELSEEDFYVLDFASGGVMRGCMANPCGGSITLDKKLTAFLSFVLRGFKVPEEEVQQVLTFLEGIDIRAMAREIMNDLFRRLAVQFNFSLEGILPASPEGADAAGSGDAAAGSARL